MPLRLLYHALHLCEIVSPHLLLVNSCLEICCLNWPTYERGDELFDFNAVVQFAVATCIRLL